MSVLKNVLFSVLVTTCAVVTLEASQQATPTFNFVSDPCVNPEEDRRLRKELGELAELATARRFIILPPGHPIGVTPGWLDWLSSCVKQKQQERFEIESVKMFTYKGQYPPGYAQARQKFIADEKFVYFDLPPAKNSQATQKERVASFRDMREIPALSDGLSSVQRSATASCTFYQAAQLVVKEAEEHAQEYQRRCDSIVLDPTEYVNARERRVTTGDLIRLPG